jgi:hypothetical protein
MTSYELSRRYFDWCFENPEKVSPNHTAIYFFAIEHCNRLGWKEKFGFPTQMSMDAIGIKKHQTYIRYFNDLVEWGFFKLVQKSTNQYSANIISLISALPKNGKAMDKAIITHAAKQTEPMRQSNGQSNSSIDKPITNNHKPNNHKQLDFSFCNENLVEDFKSFVEFRKSIKKPFTTQDQLERLYKKLRELSGGKMENAKKILDQSIVNGWQGVFELKEVKPKQEIKMPYEKRNQ